MTSAIAWLWDRFPALLAFGLAGWCITADRAELGIGFLILAILSEVMRVLVEIREALRAKAD